MNTIYPKAAYTTGSCGNLYYLVLATRIMARTVGQYGGKDYLDQTTICIKVGQCPSELMDLSGILKMGSVDMTKEQLDELCNKYNYCDLDADDDGTVFSECQ